jgi:hypothetical protein
MTTLRTKDEIRAAGAAAVKDWCLTPAQVDQVVALLMPVRSEVWRRLDEPEDTAAEAA